MQVFTTDILRLYMYAMRAKVVIRADSTERYHFTGQCFHDTTMIYSTEIQCFTHRQ